MPEIILKDKSGTEQTYDYKKVSFRTPTEGETAEFIFPNFAELEVTENGEYTVPEGVDGYTKVKANVPVPTLLEKLEVPLDFSNGDMSFEAEAGTAVKSAIIKKPETLIPENIAKDVEIAGIVGTHEGGGAVEGTVIVTFCNYDGTPLYSRPVFVGDDCPDPVEQGKIDEPTRESTVQYTYAYSGWSLTADGTASASALKAVTEDRTIYAAFVANVRYYTARFYNGATLMQEPQLVAYGSKATPPDTIKTGYDFVGWTPSDLTIYGDTDFYGEWEEFRGYTYNATLSNVFSNDGAVYNMVFSKTGDRFAYSTDKGLKIYDTSTSPYTLIKDHTFDDTVYTSTYPALAISDDGKYIAFHCTTGYSDGRLYVYEIGSWSQTFYNGGQAQIHNMTFDDTNNYLLCSTNRGHTVIDIANRSSSTKKSLTSSQGSCYANGYWFIGNGSNGLSCYKYTDGEWNEITLDTPAVKPIYIAITNDGRRVAVYTGASTTENTYTLSYDEATGTYSYDGYITCAEIKVADIYTPYTDEMAFNPAGTVLALARRVVDSSYRLTLLDMTTTPISLYYDLDQMPTSNVTSVAFSANGAHFLYSPMYGIKVFDTR